MPAFGEIGPEQAHEREASVQAEEPVTEASEQAKQALVAQVAVLTGGGDEWQERYQPLAQGPLTHEELARRKAGGGKTRPTGKKDVAKQYRPQRLPSIKEQQRMQPRQPLTRRLMLLGYSVSEKFRDANPYSTQSNLVNHMQRLLHFASEAGLEDHASIIEDWFYRTIEYYRDAAYALPGVRSHTDQGHIKRMPWFITALKNAVVDACKVLSRGEPLPEPANQARNEEMDKEAITPMLESCEEDSMQPVKPAEIDAQTSDEQSSVWHEVTMPSYEEHHISMQPGKPVEAWSASKAQCVVQQLTDTPTGIPTDTNFDSQRYSYSQELNSDSSPGEGQPGSSVEQGEVTPVAGQPEMDPFPYPARMKVKRRLERLGVREPLELKATCPRCNCRFVYTELRSDGGMDYYCCRCEPSLAWSDELFERILEVLSLPVEEVKKWGWA
ncbi:hypothetical protein KSC_012290 [Ktedonobacter sp. SOSP1-52]|nr:hypothetical protein KSC_012290 [Ktedonobacter sp. SOSP1-52]